nr:hypothetical protein GCM10020093_038840 [Planobispora longispora]
MLAPLTQRELDGLTVPEGAGALSGPGVQTGSGPGVPTGSGPDLQDVWPLAPLQRGLYFHSLLDVDVYTAQLTLDLAGPLDTARLRQAAERLVRRHPVLRASFRRLDDPVQLIHRRVEVPGGRSPVGTRRRWPPRSGPAVSTWPGRRCSGSFSYGSRRTRTG